MTDDDDLADDLDDEDDDDDGATGHACVLHWVDSLGVRLTFVATLDEAQRLAEQDPCTIPGCLGGHTIAHGDGTGRVRIIADTDTGEVMGRFYSLLRVRETHRQLRQRVNEARRQQRRREDAKREAMQREDPDVDP